MHEMGIALEIHRVCREAAPGNGIARIETVTVAVGELAAVEPDLLRFAWEAVVAGGPDTGANLEIRWCPARQECPVCRETTTRSDGSWLRLCPDCGLPLTVSGGDQLDIERIVFECEETS